MAYAQSVPAEIRETVEVLKGIFGMPNQSGYNSEQLDFIAKTFGISSGFQPYDLSAVAYYLQPVFSPFRNRTPRLHLQGKNMEFKSVTNVDTNDVPGTVAEGQIAAAIATQFADVTTYFKAYGASSDPVTFEELYAGAGKSGDFNIDARAVAVANLLKAVFIKEERMMLGGVGSAAQVATINTAPQNGLNFTIGGPMGNAPAGGALAANATGGTIPASTTVYAQYVGVSSVAIATGMPTNSGVIPFTKTNAGQSLPQTAVISATTGTGSTNSVTFTPPSYSGPVPVLGWALFLGAASGGPFYIAAFTTGAPVTVGAVPTTGLNPPTTDNTAVTSVSGGTGSTVEGMMNGILPWLYGTNSGATIQQVNGAWSKASVDTAFLNAFNGSFADPDEFWVNALDLGTLTDLLIGQNTGQPYWFAANAGNAQADMVGGFRVSRYLNPATGRIMPVNVHAYLPQGTAIALTSQLPPWYVGNNVPDTWVWGGSMDYLEVDYQPTANRKQWISEIECVGAIHCFLPSQNIVWSGITAPAA